MPILHEFEYCKPATLKDVVRLLSKYKKPALLAGGTDLVNMLKEEIEQPQIVIDLKGISELAGITFKNNVLTIGALTTFSELMASKLVLTKYPVIAEVARTVGSVGSSQPGDDGRKHLFRRGLRR